MINKKGFTLIEVMVTVAVIGVTAAAGLSLSNYLRNSSSYADARNSISSLERLISQRLNDPTLCQAALAAGSGLNNGVAAGGSDVQIKIPGIGAGDAQSSDVIGGGIVVQPLKVRISSLRLQDLQNVSGSESEANLYLRVTDTNGVSYKPELVTALILTVSGSQIVSCHGNTLQDSSEVCTQMGCTFNGAATPSCQCAPLTPHACPALQYPVSYDANGTPTCAALGGSSCPPGQYLTGLQIGHITCAPL